MQEIKSKHSNFIFRNESDLEFTDISSENVRLYKFNNGETLKILDPQFINVSASGGHRVVAMNGNGNTGNLDTCYYISPSQGWYIMWNVKEGAPHFVK